MAANPLEIAVLVASALEDCGVRYLVGGSVASSICGEPRSTLDVDMVVDLKEMQIESLLRALGDAFYADEESIRRAVRTKSSANIIHLESSIKVDLFVMGGSLIDAEQMERRERVEVGGQPARYLYVYTPEDILLQKLRWYRLGNESSDRQWRDLLGIALVQADRLDEDYLRRSAEVLEVQDLLLRLLAARGEL